MEQYQTQSNTTILPPAYLPFVEQAAERLRQGDDTLLRMIRRIDYEWEPVDIRTFIEDPEYLGAYTANLDEKWKVELEKVFAPNSSIVMLLMTGATSVGKTTSAMICLAYVLYRLACLKNPAEFYNLLKGSRIVLAIFSITLNKADTGYDMLKLYIDNSPWFKKHCPRRKRPDDPMLFPSKNIVIMIGSSALHALGENLFAFSIDEANFYHQGHAQVVGEEEKTKAHQLFTQARERIYGRFVTYGGACPGLAILMSSCRTEAHFLEQLMEEISEKPNLLATSHIVRFARWDITKGIRSIYSGKTFPVLIGDDHMNSRLLEEDEIAPEGYEVLPVPVEHSQSFEFDVEDALRDVGGISISGNLGFFSNRGQIYACVDRTRESPFLVDEITTCYPGSGNKISDYLDVRRLCKVNRSAWEPLKYPGAQRFAHVDLAATQEACFVGGTRILMEDLSEKPIEDVLVGDKVIGSDGLSHSVTAVSARPYLGKLISVKTRYKRGFVCTSEHPVLVVRKEAISYKSGVGKLVPIKHAMKSKLKTKVWDSLKENWEKPRYEPAGSLTKKDYLAVPIPLACQDTNSVLSFAPVRLTEELGWLIGMFLAEGCFVKSLGRNISIEFDLHRKEEDKAERLIYLLRKYFFVQTSTWVKPPNGRVVKTVKNLAVVEFFHQACGEYSWRKRIHLELIRLGSVSFLRGLLRGYFDGDGHLTEGDKYTSKKGGHYGTQLAAKSVSRTLATQVTYLLNTIGAFGTLYDMGQRDSQCRHTWQATTHGRDKAAVLYPERVESMPPDKYQQSIRTSKYVMVPIDDIYEIESPSVQTVYNLTVADVSSYVAGGLVVHNCGIAVGCPVPYPDGTLGVYYDLIIRVQGCPERPVDFSAVLDFLLWLGGVGIRLSKVTYDTWQSLHSVQVLSTRKQMAGIQSITLEAYIVLKSLIHTGKCSYPNYGPALKEMVQIRKSSKDKDRPHHGPQGTDDLCDAMAGVAMLVGGLDKTKKSEVGTTVATSMPIILTSSRDVGI